MIKRSMVLSPFLVLGVLSCVSLAADRHSVLVNNDTGQTVYVAVVAPTPGIISRPPSGLLHAGKSYTDSMFESERWVCVWDRHKKPLKSFQVNIDAPGTISLANATITKK